MVYCAYICLPVDLHCNVQFLVPHSKFESFRLSRLEGKVVNCGAGVTFGTCIIEVSKFDWNFCVFRFPIYVVVFIVDVVDASLRWLMAVRCRGVVLCCFGAIVLCHALELLCRSGLMHMQIEEDNGMSRGICGSRQCRGDYHEN